jgi:hypothetical protein
MGKPGSAGFHQIIKARFQQAGLPAFFFAVVGTIVMTQRSMRTTRNEVTPLPRELKGMEFLARWMDAKFRVPGTDFRFGLDGLIGLIPGVGDLSTFAISGYMVLIMAKNGASGYVLARMIFNIVVDAALGAIPFVGDIFDFANKANMKNMRLMRRYYTEGRYRGSAWKVIIPVVIVLFLVLAGIIWLIYRLIVSLF